MSRIISGPNSVKLLLENSPKKIEVLYLQSGISQKTAHSIFALAQKNKVPLLSVPNEEINKLCPDLNHQGVIAIAGDFIYLPLEKLLQSLQNQDSPLLLILDQVQDPGNLGAIIRSAKALGADGVIITMDRSAKITGGAVRASAGATELIPICQVINLASTLAELKIFNYTILGADAKASTELSDIDWTGRTAVVLGNEKKGIRQLTARHCDQLFKINMAEFESLNVSAAAAIVLYQAQKAKLA